MARGGLEKTGKISQRDEMPHCVRRRLHETDGENVTNGTKCHNSGKKGGHNAL
jgi:hypothetical protein